MTSLGGSFLDGYLPYLLRRADQTLSEGLYALLTEHGVARSEWRVLAVLEELGTMTILDLASASLSPQPTVTHAVRRLEERGLVSAATGSTDKRQRFISITDSGSTLTTMLMSEAKQIETTALANAGDLSELVSKLTELTAIVEADSQGQQAETVHGK